jgi:hypothetical protein
MPIPAFLLAAGKAAAAIGTGIGQGVGMIAPGAAAAAPSAKLAALQATTAGITKGTLGVASGLTKAAGVTTGLQSMLSSSGGGGTVPSPTAYSPRTEFTGFIRNDDGSYKPKSFADYYRETMEDVGTA